MAQRAKPAAVGSAGGSEAVLPPTVSEGVTESGGGEPMEGFLMTPQPFDLYMPDEDARYVITESQLDLLSSGGKDTSLEWALFAGGAALGFLQNFWSVASSLYNSSTPGPAALEYIGAAIFVGLTVLAAAKLIEYRGKRTNIEALKAKIKSGQKYAVGKR